MKGKIYKTDSEQGTFELGKTLGEGLAEGEVLALEGDLGAGKTVFVKGVAAGLGCSETVNSPTFVIMKVYSLDGNKKGIKELCHVDTYRLSSQEEVINIGLKDYLSDPKAVVVVEWPEKIKNVLPATTIFVRISFRSENDREIKIDHDRV
jgi:tRNA threonylcarbamoyladenosine biosynthesis protein TsaE